MNKHVFRLLLAVLLSVCFVHEAAAQKYRINVIFRDALDIQYRVDAYDLSGKYLGSNNANTGRFSGATDSDSVVFKMQMMEDLRCASSQLNSVILEMAEATTEMEEAVVVGKLPTGMKMDPPEAHGNLFIYKGLQLIRWTDMQRDNRYVFQPRLTNLLTDETRLMKPMVFDRNHYRWTQERMYDFDSSRDSLAPYYAKDVFDSIDFYIPYADTVYIRHPFDPISVDFYNAFEDYSHILRIDTIPNKVIGAIFPMKFLDYSFSSMQVQDSTYFPTPRENTAEVTNYITLNFASGSSTIDHDDPVNQVALGEMAQKIRQLELDPYTDINSLHVKSMASPDGRDERNRELSGQRAKTVLNFLGSLISDETRRRLAQFQDMTSEAQVMRWSDVVDSMRVEGDHELADQVQNILNTVDGDVPQDRAVAALPQYDRIKEHYIPMFRRVAYSYRAKTFGILTVEQIREKYRAHEPLGEYDYWKLYSAEPNDSLREVIIRDALKHYPKFMLAANDLQVILIKTNRADDRLLEPFCSDSLGNVEVNGRLRPLPQEVRINHILALMKNDRFTDANAQATWISAKSPYAQRVMAVVHAMNNDIDSLDRRILEESGFLNRVMTALAFKQNEMAYFMMVDEANEQYYNTPSAIDNAKAWYLRATCEARITPESYSESADGIRSLRKAIQLYPRMENFAAGDADLYNKVYKPMMEQEAKRLASEQGVDYQKPREVVSSDKPQFALSSRFTSEVERASVRKAEQKRLSAIRAQKDAERQAREDAREKEREEKRLAKEAERAARAKAHQEAEVQKILRNAKETELKAQQKAEKKAEKKAQKGGEQA